MDHPPFTLPHLPSLLRQAVPMLIEGVFAPLAVFYAALSLIGLNGALAAAMAWVYLGMLWRVVRRRRVPGTMALTAVAITAQAALGLWTGSAVVYFIQPEVGTICLGLILLATIRLRRPLLARLAQDYVHLPAFVLTHERVRQFFVRVTLLWAFVLIANSAGNIWLLLNESIGGFLLLRTVAMVAITGLAIAVSVWGFRRALRHLRLDTPAAPAAVGA
ncbi:VC0807 family protein [Microtetraspora niveoalba]|uniref:VC0807 family protein n=1 Tax=Microtetraspora niveoalba TaxID=46175 RepID=UPI00082FED95|nr:VC0807 family protein [Microtetraspora niveoalba]